MSGMRGFIGLAAFTAALAGLSGLAFAGSGLPEPWETGFQDAATPTMEKLVSLHSLVLYIILAVAAFVFILLAIVVVRFNAKANPTPTKTTHNTLLEMIWSGVPVIILVVIAIPSFKLLYFADRTPEPELTVKAIGHQWYWSYEYPDSGILFDSFMIEDDSLEEGQPRLLATDSHVVVPVDTNVQLLTTADDVIHSWAVPAFGVKLDAVPGRINETWFRVEEEGMYYGQCSELCGVNHGFMPIAVEAVSKETFAEWLDWAQEEYAHNSPAELVGLAVAQAAQH